MHVIKPPEFCTHSALINFVIILSRVDKRANNCASYKKNRIMLFPRLVHLTKAPIVMCRTNNQPYHAVPTAGAFDELDVLRHANFLRTIHPSDSKA
jgi:hypothetical protein